ncbi:hypothetical protein G6F24_016288 [Rhizopus arrhizus]|nr:hypothetical protein G6F24_016288 [Rhizopus arrhizus]
MPPTGNQPSFTENRMISMMPSQKLGAAKHSTANAETALSHQVLTLMADTMPAAMPTSTAMAMLASITEIQACDRTDVLQQLDGRRLVQPIRHAQAFDQRRVGDLLLGRHDVQERAGHGLDQGEVQHHHAQQQRNGLEQAAQDQTQRHGGSLTLAARRRPGFRPGRWRRW